jgi:uncharacterized glyoxalase superfamily protein PhnB
MAIAIEGAVTLLLVYDVPTSIAFYRDVLGFHVIQTSTPFDDAKDNYGWALLRKDNVELMLNNTYEDNIRPAERDAAREAAHGDTTVYFACREVDAVYAYLLEKGIAAREPRVTYYGMRQVQLFDPDGYSLVFQRPA